MTKEIFKSREQAFESVYFAKVDAELIEKIRKQKDREADRALLARATGISDEALLESILAAGVTASTLEALSLAPLICVAWGSGSLDKDEREAALNAAASEGLEKDSPSYQLYEAWLSQKPDESLLDTWREYVVILFEHLDDKGREQFRNDLNERAERIARASGGVLGIGSISKGERKVLDEIKETLA